MILMTVAAVSTVIAYSKLLFIPHQPVFLGQTNLAITAANSTAPDPVAGVSPGYLLASVWLILGLVVANGVDLSAYTFSGILKGLGTIAVGLVIYYLIGGKIRVENPQAWEGLEHLIGMMSLILIGLFWLVSQ